nr:MAG TPA: SPP1 phage holin [Myoviridae sp. ctLGX4]
MKKINLKGVTAQTWARTLVLVLALISQLAVIHHHEKNQSQGRYSSDLGENSRSCPRPHQPACRYPR